MATDKKVKILQFGEGNFLRCFVDWMVDIMNEKAGFGAAVQIVQPIGDELSPPSKALNARGGRYHTVLRGVEGGKPVELFREITCVKGVLNALGAQSRPALRRLQHHRGGH